MWNDLFYFVWSLQPVFNLMINVHVTVIFQVGSFRVLQSGHKCSICVASMTSAWILMSRPVIRGSDQPESTRFFGHCAHFTFLSLLTLVHCLFISDDLRINVGALPNSFHVFLKNGCHRIAEKQIHTSLHTLTLHTANEMNRLLVHSTTRF